MAGLDGKTHTEIDFPQRFNDPAALARSEPLAPVTGQLIFAQRSSLQGKLFDAPIPRANIRNGDFRRPSTAPHATVPVFMARSRCTVDFTLLLPQSRTPLDVQACWTPEPT